MHSIDKMVQMEDAERFNESFATFFEVTNFFEHDQMWGALPEFWLKCFFVPQLGHYLFVHLKVANLHQVKAFKVLQEAQMENESVRVEVDHLKVASKIQTTEVERLREALRKEEEASMGLRIALTLSEG